MNKVVKRVGFCLVVAMAVAFAVPAFAFDTPIDDKGNLTIQGWHFNLNIIGVDNGKNSNADMSGSDRHTIFVGLGPKANGDAVITNIYLIQTLLANDDENGNGVLDKNELFQVCDGNGFDAARDCSGNVLAGKTGASFRLPCNTHLPDTALIPLIGCDEAPANNASYEVFARALGKPGGTATIKTCAQETTDSIDPGTDVGIVCSAESVVLVRATRKPIWRNVTNELTSLCIDDDDADTLCDLRVALFAGDFVDWFWQYANKGLRHAQLRFYLTD